MVLLYHAFIRYFYHKKLFYKAYRRSETHDPKVGPGTKDPRVEPQSGTLGWDPKVGPEGGTVMWNSKV